MKERKNRTAAILSGLYLLGAVLLFAYTCRVCFGAKAEALCAKIGLAHDSPAIQAIRVLAEKTEEGETLHDAIAASCRSLGHD